MGKSDTTPATRRRHNQISDIKHQTSDIRQHTTDMDTRMDSKIPLFLFTYNLGRFRTNYDEFSDKLLEVLPEEPSTLYVFGFQEFCSILAGCFPELAKQSLLAINKVVIQTLKRKYGGAEDIKFYTLSIHSVGAVGQILVTPYILRFDRIQTSMVGCGYYGSSMKGAVGARIRYSDVQDANPVELTFAVCHLAAGEGEYYYLKRNSNLIQIMRSLVFDDGWSFLKQNNHSFIMGDMNYRSCKKFDKKSDLSGLLFSLCDQTEMNQRLTNVEELFEIHDELLQGRLNEDVLTGFNEGFIRFRPTYKYNRGTAIYNSKRSPSWCDRIFYQSTYKTGDGFEHLEGNQPVIQRYDSLPTLLESDHQPVFLDILIPSTPPQSIISLRSGYLQILPNEIQLQGHHRRIHELNDELSISGPTQIYMKYTKIDYLLQTVVRPITDSVIGYGLWFSTTTRGRLQLLVLILLLCLGYYVYTY